MKYSEFLQLDEILRSNGSNISQELGLAEPSKLNEADTDAEVEKPTVDTEKTNWVARRVSKRSNLKNKLNKTAKTHQEKINKNIINKFYPKMLQGEAQLVKLALKAAEEEKNPEEIKKLVAANIDRSAKHSATQFNVIDSAIKQYLDNVGSQFNKKIESSKLNDDNKTGMKNYWLLLRTQLHMNAIIYLQNLINKKVQEMLGDNAEVKNIIDAAKEQSPTQNIITNTLNKVKKAVPTAKETVKSWLSGKDESTEETREDTSKKEVLLEKGKIYDYKHKDKNGTRDIVNRIRINDIIQKDEKIEKVKAKAVNGEEFEITGDDLKNILVPKNLKSQDAGRYKETQNQSAQSETKPAETKTQAPETKPAETKEFKVGKMYKVTDVKGKEAKIKIEKIDGDTFTISRPSAGKGTVEKSRDWMNKNVKESIEEPDEFKMVAEDLNTFLKQN